jgi:hypothetical protein
MRASDSPAEHRKLVLPLRSREPAQIAQAGPGFRLASFFALVLLAVMLSGCASAERRPRISSRPFEFKRDTLAYPNELVWFYGYDAEGKWQSHRREPTPDYAQHCFVVARTVRQFFENARFEPGLPVADAATYRQLVRRVVATSPSWRVAEADRVVFPGYADLRTFSQAHEKLLKEECGGAWRSYVQRGNWRMIFPFSRSQQAEMAQQLLTHLTPDHPVVLHLSRFPQLSINHAVVVYEAKPSEKQIEFAVYDPNQPEQPTVLTFNRATRTFLFPQCSYFPGGRVDVYEIYWKWDY